MAEHVDDRHRQVVPRWRPFRAAATLGQLDAAAEVRRAGFPDAAPGELEELQRDWAQHRTPFHAANLVDAALILGKRSVAREAAEWLVKNGGVSDVSIALARQVLSPSTPPEPSDPPELIARERYSIIASYRHRLRRMPRDPLLWVDLAREYSALGQLESARRALQTAIGLAPNNRFVLRSASRFFLHAHDPDRAHHILRSAASTPNDPWLVAAEIVAAEATGRQSRLVRTGTRILESGRFRPRHVSELASAIGTLEHQAGRRREVRKLFAQALTDPTENSVAQAAWVARHMSGFSLPDSSFSVPRAFEARAWESAQDGDYADAVSLSWEWLRDEPFAARPALFGSWVASTAVGDYDEAVRLVEAAMVANPDEPRLIAQLLYCEASAGNIEKAEGLLSKLEGSTRKREGSHSAAEWDVLLNADRGLIAYRRGKLEQGREFYSKALEIASANGLRQFAASAFINFVREEALANPASQVNILELTKAVEAFPPGIRGIVTRFVERIPVLTLPGSTFTHPDAPSP